MWKQIMSGIGSFIHKFFNHFYLIFSVLFFLFGMIGNGVIWFVLSLVYLLLYSYNGGIVSNWGVGKEIGNDNEIKKSLRTFFGSWVFLATLELLGKVGKLLWNSLIVNVLRILWRLRVVFLVLSFLFFAYLFWVSELRSDCRMEEARKYCEWKGKDYEPELGVSNVGIFYCSQGRYVNIYTLTEMEFEFCKVKVSNWKKEKLGFLGNDFLQ